MTGELDLQEALKLYRRQGIVSAQNQHLQRTLSSAPYPYEATDRGGFKGSLEILTKYLIKPNITEGATVGVPSLSITLKDTTKYSEYVVKETSQVHATTPSLSVVLKETTRYVEYTVGPLEAATPSVGLSMVLTPEAIAHTHTELGNFTGTLKVW